MRVWPYFPLLLVACSGAPNSELFAPVTGSTGPASAPPTTNGTDAAAPSGTSADAGALATSDASIPSTPDDAGGDDDAESRTFGDDSGPPPGLDAGTDAGSPGDTGSDAASAETCPLAGKAMSMIDDGSWKSPNASILPECGRSGAWYVFNDGASVQSPSMIDPFGPFLTADAPNGVTGYVRTYGTLSRSATGTAADPHWGAGFGFDIDSGSGTSFSYSVSPYAYQGVSFWVRTGATSEAATITFGAPTRETTAYSDGAFHVYVFTAPVGHGVWTKVTVPFTSLVQPSWTPASERVPFDTGAIVTLQWNFTSQPQAVDFDVEIGDVEFW